MDPKPCRDRGGDPFEITLELWQGDRFFGTVGERCGYSLATLAVRLAASRTAGSPQARRWPDLDDRFPDPARGSLAPHLWRERELFAFRRRDRGDGVGAGELRCTVRTFASWLVSRPAPGTRGAREGGAAGVRGRWRLARRAVVEAWGVSGRGLRATLTSSQLARFLGDLLEEAERVGTSYRDLLEDTSMSQFGR